jgi:hypothetical protein
LRPTPDCRQSRARKKKLPLLPLPPIASSLLWGTMLLTRDEDDHVTLVLTYPCVLSLRGNAVHPRPGYQGRNFAWGAVYLLSMNGRISLTRQWLASVLCICF